MRQEATKTDMKSSANDKKIGLNFSFALKSQVTKRGSRNKGHKQRNWDLLSPH